MVTEVNTTAESDGDENTVEDNSTGLDTYTGYVNKDTTADKADKIADANKVTMGTDANKTSPADKAAKADNAATNEADEHSRNSINNLPNQNQAADVWTAANAFTAADTWTAADDYTAADAWTAADHCLTTAELERYYRNFLIYQEPLVDDEVEFIGDVMMVLGADPPKPFNRHHYKSLPIFSGDQQSREEEQLRI